MKKYIKPETTLIPVEFCPLLTGSKEYNDLVIVDAGDVQIPVYTKDDSGAGSIIEDAKAWKGGVNLWEEDN